MEAENFCTFQIASKQFSVGSGVYNLLQCCKHLLAYLQE